MPLGSLVGVVSDTEGILLKLKLYEMSLNKNRFRSKLPSALLS